MTDPTKQVYPDTAQGAIRALADLSDVFEVVEQTPEDATAIPDPWVYGVWKVEAGDPEGDPRGSFEAIVYLAGYKTPIGDRREYNDFEVWFEDESDGLPEISSEPREEDEESEFEVESPWVEAAEAAIDLDLPSDEEDEEVGEDGIPVGFERLPCGLLVRVGGAA